MRKVAAVLVLLCGVCLSAQEDPIALYGRAEKAYAAGEYAEAAELYRGVVAGIPRSAAAKVALARSLARTGKAGDALAQLEAATAFGGRFDDANPAFDSLRSDPRFARIVEVMRARSAPLVRSEVAFLLEKDLIPENIVFDPKSGTFLVGSMYKAKIVRIASNGVAQTPEGRGAPRAPAAPGPVSTESATVTDFVSSQRDGLMSVLGMKIDPARRELWVASGNFGDSPPIENEDPATKQTSAIFRFHLDSGKLLAKYPAPKGSAESPVLFNDLVLSPEGDVYITAGDSGIYRIRRGGTAAEPWFARRGAWFNGITISPDGRSVFGASHLEGVVKIDVATKASTLIDMPAGVTLGGIDGLYFHDRSLVGVQNGTDPSRVIRAWLNPELTRVTGFAVLEQAHPLSDIPLTGTIVGNDLYYVARSQLRAFEQGKIWPMEKLKESVILKLPLDPAGPAALDLAKERASLLEVYRSEVRAHFERDADWLADSTADPFVYVGGGKIARQSRESSREFFTGYFKGATYLQYDDLEPPIVRVSDDGSIGWVISRVTVRRVQEGKEAAFVYAGAMMYEKRGGEWVRVANVSTFEGQP